MTTLFPPRADFDPKSKPPAAAVPWLPVRSLARHHRPRILSHLLALEEHDRYLSIINEHLLRCNGTIMPRAGRAA